MVCHEHTWGEVPCDILLNDVLYNSLLHCLLIYPNKNQIAFDFLYLLTSNNAYHVVLL